MKNKLIEKTLKDMFRSLDIDYEKERDYISNCMYMAYWAGRAEEGKERTEQAERLFK